MRRILPFMLISLAAALTGACGGSTPAATDVAKNEAACVQPTEVKPGETPTCSEGCKWNGTECKQERGVVVHDTGPQVPPVPTPDHPTPPPDKPPGK